MTAVSRAFINSCVPSSVTVVIQLIAPSGAPGLARRLVHDFGDAGDAAHRRRVRAQDDRAARLYRDQNLVNRCRRRICRRDDGTDDAEGFGDFDDLAVFEAADDADGLDRLDEAVDLFRREQVLLDLVGDDAVAGFFVREAGEGFGLRRDGGGHRVDQRVDLLLGELRQDGGGFPGPAGERPRLLNGCEVAIVPRRSGRS